MLVLYNGKLVYTKHFDNLHHTPIFKIFYYFKTKVYDIKDINTCTFF